jgi:transposase InsO family protein
LAIGTSLLRDRPHRVRAAWTEHQPGRHAHSVAPHTIKHQTGYEVALWVGASLGGGDIRVLRRSLFVFVIIELSSRRLVHFGNTRNPTDARVAEQLCEATPSREGPQHLIRDNDRKYDRLFARVATGTGIEVLRTPYGASRANAICKRFLGSAPPECLDHFPISGERYLYRVVKEHQRYFTCARPHQGTGQRIPCQPEGLPTLLMGAYLISHPVWGSLHHDYRWRAVERPSYPRVA